MMTDLFLILAVAVGVPLIGAISAVVYGSLTERKSKAVYSVRPCACYMPYCLEHRENDASNLTYVEEKDEMKPQCVYLDRQRGVWFHPITKKDKNGGQYGYMLDNPLGIAVIKDPEVNHD